MNGQDPQGPAGFVIMSLDWILLGRLTAEQRTPVYGRREPGGTSGDLDVIAVGSDQCHSCPELTFPFQIRLTVKWLTLNLKSNKVNIVNTVSSPSQAKQHVAPRAATRSLQIPSSTSLPLVKLGQNRYEPPASMFAKSQTDWPFGWSAKQAKRSNHDPA